MSVADVHWERMEKLAEAETCLIVEFIPYAPIGTTFARLETYMEEHYRPVHAEKMVMLLLLLAYRYPHSVIYVEDHKGFFYKDHSGLEHDLDVRHFPPEKLASYIRDIIVNERPISFTVYVPNINCLMRITGGFSNEIYGQDEEFLALVRDLAGQQGLFIREVANVFHPLDLKEQQVEDAEPRGGGQEWTRSSRAMVRWSENERR